MYAFPILELEEYNFPTFAAHEEIVFVKKNKTFSDVSESFLRYARFHIPGSLCCQLLFSYSTLKIINNNLMFFNFRKDRTDMWIKKAVGVVQII